MAGSRSSIDVFLSLHGQRKFAKEVAASGAELEAMGVKGAKSMARFAKSADRLKGFGKSWTHNVTLPILGLGVASGYMAADFKRSVLLLHTQAGVASKDLGGLEKAFLRISRLTTFSPKEISEAGYRLAGAGLRGKELEEATLKSAQLAMVGGASPEDTAKTLSQIWFTNIKGGKDFNKVIGEINATVGAGDLRLPNLVEALGTGVVAAGKQAGLSLQDVTGALAVFGDETNNVSGWSAQLATALHYLYAPTEKAEGALNSLGLSGTKLGKAMHGPNGLATALGMLKKPLEELPGGADGTQAAQVLSKILPGGKGRVLLVLLNQLERLEQKEKQIKGTTDEFGKSLRETEKNPKVKLEKAWSSLQASLVELGGELLPAAVPALETIASDTEKVAHAFMALPGPVKAATLGLLVLTGPVASGLGYFASGVGRALILTAKLGRVAQNVGIFTQALRAGQGIKGSAAIGFNGFGQSAAVQTAKGFAYSLGPAVAAYGIGNIITSATSGDWEDAGFEAGGAMAGGIAGFLVGGPLGAMLGVGAGSLVGELFGDLFKSTPKVSKIRGETEHLTDAMKGYRDSLKGIKPAEKELADSRRRHRGASAEEVEADRKLHHALTIYGEDSWQAHRAQLGLWRAQKKVISTGKEEAAMHRLTGNRLQLYRENSLHAVASIKQLMPTQKRRIRVLNKENKEGKLGHKGLEELVKLEGRVRREKHQLTKVYAKAETLAGKPWAKRLEGLTALQGKYGTKGKVLVDRLHEQTDAFKELKEKGAVVPGVYRKIAREIRATSRELAEFHAQTEGLGVVRLPGEGPTGKNHPRPHVTHPRNGRRRRNRNAAQRLNLRQPGALASALTGPTAPNSRGGDLTVTIPVNLDGREVARSTARVAKDEALLQ